MAAQTELTISQLPGAVATAPGGQAAAAPEGKRLLFIDNFRILLICGVLVAHLNDTYGGVGSWMYRDPAAPDMFTVIFLSILNAIGMASGMGLFFLLAGYFTPGSYDRKGGASFLRDRLVRLGMYLHRVDSIADGPIWFVELLLFFSLFYAAWRWLTRQRPQAATGTGRLPGSRAIFGFILALGLVSFVVRIWWPAGWVLQPFNLPAGYLPQYVSLYVLGIVAYRRNWFFKLTPRMGRDWSLIALMATLIIFGGLVVPSFLQAAGAAGTQQAGYALAGGFNWGAFGYALWEAFVVVGVGIGLLVLFRQRWNHQGRVARSLAPTVYLVYLIHPVVLVGFAYAFHVVALYPLLKWGIAVLITIPLCFLVSLVIRKIPLVNRVV